ncbi:sodium/calcium exchanger protein [Isoalcanivorax pacificus W11-5]|uniref:Sodium/calcium exchanger protein n=1 Tax=Isoalcanivorax pacificus W11-5 TaxID=391936 RepID=A0A0B4XL95_9GAMM|nr:calcium/sodium antiporter [Isoalcanivorax pacificus]AJD47338.1 sodium/calcium exchanger protein [Isoalcanivorax pacificus W11-5]
MLLAILACIAGLIALVWSADRFVGGASGLALRLGMTPMTVGLTLVALGTSAPEILVSTAAALTGSSDLAIGNALGSNIANIGMVLGITLLVSPILLHRDTLRQDMPACLLVALLAGALMYDGQLSRLDGVILIGALLALIALMWQFRRGQVGDEGEIPEHGSTTGADLWLFISGLLVLLISARILVWGAVELARTLGVSETVIGLTLVAVGTSLPELAASVAAALRKHADLAIGNVVGSNIMNLVTVLPVPALVAPGLIEPSLVHRDYPAMLGITVLLMLAMLLARRRTMGRVTGGVLLAAYGAYLGLLVMQS